MKKIYKLDTETEKILQDTNYNFDRLFIYFSNIFNILFKGSIKPFIEIEEFRKLEERDKLEINIEFFLMLYCLENDINYKEIAKDVNKTVELTKECKSFNLLMKYKMLHFGKDILKEIGLELVDVTNKGYVVRELEESDNLVN